MGVKTYKREVAVVMLTTFYGFCVIAALGDAQALDVARILSVPTHLAVGGAFGLDAYARQVRAGS